MIHFNKIRWKNLLSTGNVWTEINLSETKATLIIGDNGAGKSTAMKAIFGMIDLRRGSIYLNGSDITSMQPQDRVRLGMAFVPQTNNVFSSLTVEENLEMGAYLRRDEIKSSLEQVYGLFSILKKI